MRHVPECVTRLSALGIEWEDAFALRRIAMTLHRWYELECGDNNNHGSWCITRGHKWNGSFDGPAPNDTARKNGQGFIHDDDGLPYLEHHHYRHGQGEDYVTYTCLPDRERGAQKRLAKIMQKYPQFEAYLQTDPRGAPLYILNRANTPQPYDQFYSRGIAVYK